MKAKELAEKFTKILEDVKDMPEEVEKAIGNLMGNVKDDEKVPWYKAPFFKDGKFSKTAMFATIVNVLVITSYIMGWFKGTELGPWTVPAFDSSASFAIMAMANGTYVVNNQIKKRIEK